MKRKIEQSIETIVGVLSKWEDVDTIAVIESGEDFYDPYFFISVDCYCTGTIPPSHTRRDLFPGAVAFESLHASRKDRFLMQDIPFRIEYKDQSYFDSLLHTGEAPEGAFRDTGTYMLYRLRHGRVVFKRSDWIDEARKDLDALNHDFWNMLRTAFQARMEHFLGDLYAAIAREDELFYLVSSSGFIRTACSVLFVINHRFEPSGRLLSSETRKLPTLPDSFLGRFDSFLRTDPALTPNQKAEVADLLARSIVAL